MRTDLGLFFPAVIAHSPSGRDPKPFHSDKQLQLLKKLFSAAEDVALILGLQFNPIHAGTSEASDMQIRGSPVVPHAFPLDVMAKMPLASEVQNEASHLEFN